ncbi:class I adenylate-forming enzyme family protein [Caenimonas soli]|uniref:class I adenylate-forming enzyme family protein n=1 Tax=Caenimonas soli TaxID=2735555 RepID=UPI0015567FF2|nr:AMP-binding protein [Caenimonas soli]NPC58263.1 AMP-binding protein [Caenimonas soli]
MAVPSPPLVLADVLAAHAAARADAVALSFEGGQLRYGELCRRCERLAAQLWHGWGVRPGDRVAWLGANHPGQLVLLFALARIGAILLPLNFRLSPGEWDALMVDCAPAHLVHDDAWAAAAQELAARHGLAVHPAEALTDEGDWPSPPCGAESRSPVLLVYTSGTTSRAKAAVHTQANLLANMAIAAQVQKMTAQDVVATMLPLFHVGGLCIQTLPALYVGARVILHARFAAEAALDCFERDRPTLTLQVPATMKALIEQPRWDSADLASLRAVWAGSSLLPAGLVQAFHARGLTVCNVYGATETGPFSIALAPEQARSHPGSCGWPAPGVEVRLGDEQAGVGELLIRGPNVISRYWPDLPACDPQGWFHTGDLATRARDGAYTVVGRAKDLIISGGENIHPAEIESLLAEHPAVAECAAFGLPDDEWGEVVAAAVVLKPGQAVSEQELRSYLTGRLARYKLPRHWLWLAGLPKTALGKVQRQALAQLIRSDAADGQASPTG